MKNNGERHFMYFTIYKITNNLDGKFYIGMHKTSNLEDGYFGSGKLLKYAVNKHGIDNFQKEYLFIFDNYQDMMNKEIELVNEELIKNPLSYNLTVGGWGGNRIVDSNHPTWSAEHTSRMGLALKKSREENVVLDQKLRLISSTTLEASHKAGKMRYDTFSGKKHSEKSKRLIGSKNKQLQSGEGNSQFGTKWITNGIENRKMMKDEELPNGWKYGRVGK